MYFYARYSKQNESLNLRQFRNRAADACNDARRLAELVAVGLSVVALKGSRRVTSAIIWPEPSSRRRLEH